MKHIRKITAAALSILLTVTCAIPAFADGTTPSSKEEVIYVMTDNAGQVNDMEAVNIFAGGNITDYGNYSKVKILNTTDTITQKNDKITFSSDAGKVYYQGTMKKKEIPWNISIRYFLDGKEYSADKVAGKSGALKICFTVRKNKNCEGSFYEDYALQAAFTLDTEKCENIKAKDATIANVGKNKQLSYIVLPGKGIDTYITADVKKFEMDAVSINGLKLNLNIEVDYAKIDKKADTAKEAVKKLDNGAGEIKAGTEKIDDAAQELKEKTAEFYDGTGKLSNGAAELSGGLKKITNNNLELTDGAYKAFEGICTASETILNEKLTENGMSKISLTPYNYTSKLEALLNDLNEAKIYQAAYNEAYYKVSKKVEAQEDTLYYQAALQAVKAQLLQSEAFGEETKADAYLQTEEGQALIANAAAGMTDDQKAQIKDAYIKQMMQSSEVTSQINQAVRKADKAAEQVEDLKSQLDNYRKFYDGLCSYTGAVTEAKDAADELSKNMRTLDENMGLLNGAIAEFREKIGELSAGVSKLKEGTEKFLEEISNLKGEVHNMISDMIDDLKGKGMLRSFLSEKNTEIASVQFVIKTDAISAGKDLKTEESVQETVSFWQKLLRLFGLY